MKYPLTEKEIFDYRPIPFYFLTTQDEKEYAYKKVKKSLKNLKDDGFGGYILFNKPPKGFTAETYLSDKWFRVVKTFAIVSKELGLKMWINDGFNFPPGNVAGRVEKVAPHLKQKSIYRDKDGAIKVKEAEWGFPAFEEPMSGELFIKFVHEEYKKQVGEYFGEPIKGFFSDGDNRRVLYTVMRDPNSPMRDYFPWSTDFEKDFKEKYGYEIMPVIDDVLQRKDTPVARDYWEFAGLIYHRWFANNYKWLKENGLEYTGHTGDTSPFLQTEAPRSSAFTEGRFSDIQRNFDYPGTDQELYAIDGGKHMRKEPMYTPHYVWGEKELNPKMTDYSLVKYDTRAKQAGATAYMYDKKGAMSEMFAATNYGVSPEALKQIAAYQIMQGVTFVVPHAYYYRFFGQIKHFAPPDFAEHSMLKFSNKKLNDELAQNALMLNKGEKVYPIALLDPTENVWRNNFNGEEYFSCFEKLNRMPHGFTICDFDKVCSSKFPFKVAIPAGIKLTEQQKLKLQEKGIAVVLPENLDTVSDFIDCNVKYVGEGTPHFNRRIIDGEEFTFISNIEQTTPIKGRIFAYGRKLRVTLYPGDIKYVSKNYTDIENKRKGKLVASINGEVPVKFKDSNLVLIERFENGGVAVTKNESKALEFKFSAIDQLENLKLSLPKISHNQMKVTFDGKILQNKKGKAFDDEVLFYDIDKVVAGEHTVKILTNKLFNSYDRVLLEGEFDCVVETDKTEYKNSFGEYNLSLFIPKTATVTLSKRRTKLSVDKSWAEQGQLFYSGKTEYFIDVPNLEKGNYVLSLPSVRDFVTLKIDGKAKNSIIRPPYDFKFTVKETQPKISIQVINSHANAIEGYAEESGIVGGIQIYKK